MRYGAHHTSASLARLKPYTSKVEFGNEVRDDEAPSMGRAMKIGGTETAAGHALDATLLQGASKAR